MRVDALRAWAAHARSFGRWWAQTLADSLPAAFKPGRRLPRAEIRLAPGSVEVLRVAGAEGTRFVDARPLAALNAAGWEQLAGIVAGARTVLRLEAPEAYAPILELPAAARTRLRSAVAFQLDRVAPIPREQLVWNHAVIGASRERVEVQVAMARSTRLSELTLLFDQAGIPMPAIHADTAEGGIELAPGARVDSPERAARRRAAAIALVLFCSIPFTTIALTRFDLSMEEARIERLQRDVAPTLAAERHIAQAEAIKASLRVLQRQPLFAGTLEQLAAKLPQSAYLRSADKPDGHSLTFEVTAQDTHAFEKALGEIGVAGSAKVVDQAANDPMRITVTAELP